MDPTTTLTFAALLTPGGIVLAAALITTLVEIVKTAFPPIDARVSGAALAFIASAVLYLVAAFVLPDASPDLYLAAFAAWVAVASSAIGIKSGVSHVRAVSTPPGD